MENNKPKLNLKPYDDRVDKVFPSAILTLVSIIQGVAFYILMDRTFTLITTNTFPITRLLPYDLLSLTNLIIVAFEYIWFVGLFTGTISVLDISFVFAIGVGEIAPMYYMKDPYQWWLLNGIFLVVGSLAYTNSLMKAKNIDYDNDKVAGLVTTTLTRNRNLCLFGAGISLGCHFLLSKSWDPCITTALGFTFTIILFSFFLFKNQAFLRDVRTVCITDSAAMNTMESTSTQQIHPADPE